MGILPEPGALLPAPIRGVDSFGQTGETAERGDSPAGGWQKAGAEMKFGVTFPQTEIGDDPIAIRDFAQAAEGAGFDYLAAFDHILGAHPDRFVGRDVGFPAPPYLSNNSFHEPLLLV